jgi:hypothetical protein
MRWVFDVTSPVWGQTFAVCATSQRIRELEAPRAVLTHGISFAIGQVQDPWPQP